MRVRQGLPQEAIVAGVSDRLLGIALYLAVIAAVVALAFSVRRLRSGVGRAFRIGAVAAFAAFAMLPFAPLEDGSGMALELMLGTGLLLLSGLLGRRKLKQSEPVVPEVPKAGPGSP